MKQVIGLLILATLGVGFYVLVSSGGEGSETVTSPTQAIEVEDQVNIANLTATGTMADLISMGSIKCSFRSEHFDEGLTVSTLGKIYHAADQIRVDSQVFASVDIGAGVPSVSGDMIIVEDTVYVWSDKMAVETDLARLADAKRGELTSVVNLFDRELQYDCEEWDVDQAVFIAPADLDFVPLDTILEADKELTAEKDLDFVGDSLLEVR